MKITRFQLERRNGRLQLTDTDRDNAPLTAVQAERLGRALLARAKQMKRAHQYLTRRPIGGGG